jgi:DNA-binding response OmpR family regulator
LGPGSGFGVEFAFLQFVMNGVPKPMEHMNPPRVLLVEDNRLLRWWMTSSLQHAGFVVAAPDSLSEAMQLCQSGPIDMLVTDWHLGEEGDGFQVLDCTRRLSPEVFAVLISAEADADLAEHARCAGFDVVIEKPFPVAEIVGAVHAWEERLQARRRRVPVA